MNSVTIEEQQAIEACQGPARRPECTRCGQCCLGAPCDLAEHMVHVHAADLGIDITWTEASGEVCPLLTGPVCGEYECLVYSEIMAISWITESGVFAPGCCLSEVGGLD